MHTRGSKTTDGNCKPRGERSQGRRKKAVVATWHAQRRGRERQCPVAAAKAAVRRNMRDLRRACPQRSDRAAIDYCQAIAIVERKSRRQFIVITILKAW